MKSFVLESDNGLDMKGKHVWHTLLHMWGHLGHPGTPWDTIGVPKGTLIAPAECFLEKVLKGQ